MITEQPMALRQSNKVAEDKVCRQRQRERCDQTEVCRQMSAVAADAALLWQVELLLICATVKCVSVRLLQQHQSGSDSGGRTSSPDEQCTNRLALSQLMTQWQVKSQSSRSQHTGRQDNTHSRHKVGTMSSVQSAYSSSTSAGYIGNISFSPVKISLIGGDNGGLH